MLMCALLRWWRQLCASSSAGTCSNQKSTGFLTLREKKVWKELSEVWDRIKGRWSTALRSTSH